MLLGEHNFYKHMYGRAARPEDLPWYRNEPPALLKQAIEARRDIERRRGQQRALDIGCGAGLHSIYMAQQGLDVTGVDFVPRALDMARERTQAAHVKVNLFQSDFIKSPPRGQFDLILDAGCLHSFAPIYRARYKRNLLQLLGPDADYILIHFGKRYALDWRPIGPLRRTHKALKRFFGPELVEHSYQADWIDNAPLWIGRTLLVHMIWFKRRAMH